MEQQGHMIQSLFNPKVLKQIAIVKQLIPAFKKTKKGYGYNYAPLDAVDAIISPILLKNDLNYIHIEESIGDKNYLVTILYLVSDPTNFIYSRSVLNETSLAGMNMYQVIGSAITYFRRYHITSMLGLLSESDNDGSTTKTSTSAPSKGKSETQSDSVDFVSVFQKQIDKGHDKDRIIKLYDSNKSSMDEAMQKSVMELISKKFGDLPF